MAQKDIACTISYLARAIRGNENAWLREKPGVEMDQFD
jgi:hypothetical protein